MRILENILDTLLNFLAMLLANDTVLNWLIKYSYTKPYTDLIMRETKEVYMHRWWIMPKWTLLGNPLDNYATFMDTWLPFSIRLHHITGMDPGLHLHDHPANYRSFVLKGWYIESDIYRDTCYRFAGTTRKANATNFHQIVDVSEGGAWTIFIMGRHCNKWGFLVDGRKVSWKDHMSS